MRIESPKISPSLRFSRNDAVIDAVANKKKGVIWEVDSISILPPLTPYGSGIFEQKNSQ